MKLGFNLYRHQLTPDHYRFARQCGATHLVIHLVDYFAGANDNHQYDQPVGSNAGWGYATDPNDPIWSLDSLTSLRREINEAGLELTAIENFSPAHWYDVLLGGPQKLAQLEHLKTIIQNVGKAGIPVLGYNFSIAGVGGRIKGPFARGNAIAVGMDGAIDDPIPNGMVWNMIYNPNAAPGTVPPATQEQLWQRLKEFLDVLLPVAEASNVILAAHPDDPPLPTLRGQPRLVYQPHLYQKLLDLHPSPSNGLEFCLGTIAEMSEGDLYEAVDTYSRQNKIAYLHFRNVTGKAPHYRETFIDDGDVNMLRVLQILHKNNYQGVLVPDHVPQMTCNAPWHAGMAYACGWMKAALLTLQR